MSSYNDHSLPVHRLELFRGARVSLLRNIALSMAMANGSSFIVVDIGRHVIRLMNITPGDFYGAIETIFRVRLKVTLKDCFLFTRLQFPLRMAHAGSAHKYQGQTCVEPAHVLYDIRTPPFCHGQTYVGLSRAQKSKQVVLLSLPEYGRSVPCLIYPKLAKWDEFCSDADSSTTISESDTEESSTTSRDSQISDGGNSDTFSVTDISPRPIPHSDMLNSNELDDVSTTNEDSTESD